VGEGVLPEQSDLGFDDAGAVTFAGLSALAPGEPIARNFFPIRFAEGVAAEDGLAELRRSVDHYTVPVQRATDLVNFGRADFLPVLGAGLLAVIATAMLAHLLLSSVRRRRRDLALLKVLGFTRAQVRLTVAWQVSTLAAVALAVGLPIGIAAGRWAWTTTAHRLGVLAQPVVPLLVLALLVPMAVAVANLAAALPARLAARTRAAVVLQSD
jgi:predicted lysophospholipase L1 biosynthesis ABC-type transport system permease subunit